MTCLGSVLGKKLFSVGNGVPHLRICPGDTTSISSGLNNMEVVSHLLARMLKGWRSALAAIMPPFTASEKMDQDSGRAEKNAVLKITFILTFSRSLYVQYTPWPGRDRTL